MSKGKIIALVLSILLIIGGGILFSPSKTVLAVSNRKNPKQRIYSVQAVKDGFVISYTHSVNKGRIHDYYECEQAENALVLKSMHFVSYGAGIPEPDEYPGANFIALEDCYIISNINRVIPSLVMAVGVIAVSVEKRHHANVFHSTILNDGIENNLSMGIYILQFVPCDSFQKG